MWLRPRQGPPYVVRPAPGPWARPSASRKFRGDAKSVPRHSSLRARKGSVMEPLQPYLGGRLAPPSDDGEKRFSSQPGGDVEGEEGRTGGVLIVEDDFLIGMQTESALVNAGISVVGIAATAEEAV